MRNNLTGLSVRLFLLASVAGCQVLIASAAAVAAEGPGESEKDSLSKPLSFHAPVAVRDLTAPETEKSAAPMNPVRPRKGEIFRGSSQAGVAIPASTWPDPELYL